MLVVKAYDGLTRPSEVVIDSILIWVRFYDLPPALMSEEAAKKLGRQLGKVHAVDTRSRAT